MLPHLRFGCMVVILAAAFMSRIQPLNRGLGQDELFTAVNFVQAGSIWTTMSSNSAFNNHIGYSVMARISTRLFGGSEWALRLPALLLGFASLYLFWVFSEPILTSFGAAVGVLLLALSPPHVVWSVEARGYSAMVFFAILSSYFYLRLLRRPTRLAALWYVLANVGGIYVHLYSVFVIAIQSLVFVKLVISKSSAEQAGINLTPASRRLVFLSFIAIAILSMVAYAPVAQTMVNDLVGRGHGRFDPTFPWAIIQRLSGSEQFLITGLMVLISVFGGYSLWNSRPLEARYFILLLVVPVLLTWVARPFDLYPRFFAYWLPFYIVFFVAGLAALRNLARSDTYFIIRFLPSAAAAMVLITVLYYWTASRSQYIPDEGYREASAAAVFGAHDGVRYCAIGGARSVWRYYIHQPIAIPASVNELQKLSQTAGEVRCVYYEASWQSEEQRRIAEFLRQHGTWQKIRELTVFRYEANQNMSVVGPRDEKFSEG